MILLTHPTGNNNVRAVLEGLFDSSLLTTYFTGIALNEKLVNRLPIAYLRNRLSRRSYPVEILSDIRSFPQLDLFRHIYALVTSNASYPSCLSSTTLYERHDALVANYLSRQPHYDAVYAYEDSALRTFQVAAEYGLKKIYDLPIGYWKASQDWLRLELQDNPSWCHSLSILSDTPAKLCKKDEELILADRIVVPSNFVRSTILRYHSSLDNIHVIPFGFPSRHRRSRPSKRTPHCKLRALFVGSITQRKGLSYLLNAFKSLSSVAELTLVGSLPDSTSDSVKKELQNFTVLPPLPHKNLLEFMHNYDFLVLPSLFEGFALVINEALSCGLPVIATYESGVTESVRHGKEGLVIPSRSSDAIIEAVLALIDDPDMLEMMSLCAQRRSKSFSWHSYKTSLIQLCRLTLES